MLVGFYGSVEKALEACGEFKRSSIAKDLEKADRKAHNDVVEALRAMAPKQEAA